MNSWQLRKKLGEIRKEIVRLQDGIQSIAGHAGSLHIKPVLEQFSEAEQRGEEQLQILQEKLQNGLQILARAEKLLQLSQQRRWPGEPIPGSLAPNFPDPEPPQPPVIPNPSVGGTIPPGKPLSQPLPGGLSSTITNPVIPPLSPMNTPPIGTAKSLNIDLYLDETDFQDVDFDIGSELSEASEISEDKTWDE